MEKYKDIYNQFYNSDPKFQSTFQDLKSFDEYVGDNNAVIDELKEVFDFGQPQEQIAQAQPDVPFPVESDSELKKKEESISPSTSDGSSLASTSQSNIELTEEPKKPKRGLSLFGKKEPKVEVPDVSLDLNPNDIIDEFEKKNQQYADLRQMGVVGETAGSILTLNLNNFADLVSTHMGYFGLSDALFNPEVSYGDQKLQNLEKELRPYEKQMSSIFKRQFTGVSNDDGMGFAKPLINKFNIEFDKDGKEIRTAEYNEDVVKSLLKVERTTADAVGPKEINYKFVPNEDEIESYAAESWEENQKRWSPENPKSWEDVKNTKTGDIYKSVIRTEVKQGIEQIQIGEEIDKEFLRVYNATPEEISDNLKKQAAAIQSQIVTETKAKANDILEEQTAIVTEAVSPILEEVETYVGGFKSKYEPFLNTETGAYEFQTQEQIDAFNTEYASLTDFVADKNNAIEVLKAQGLEGYKNAVKTLISEADKQGKERLGKLSSGIYSQSSFSAVVQSGVSNYFSKKEMEEKYAAEKMGYGDLLGSIIAKSSFDSLAGLGLLAEQYGAGKGTISSFFTNLGNYRNEYEFAALNPSVLKRVEMPDGSTRDESLGEFFERIVSNEGAGEFLGDAVLVSAKSFLPSLPIMASAIIMKNAGVANSTVVGSAALASFVHDTSMQLTEQYDAVFAKTNSILMADEASRKQLGSQLDLFYTYVLDAGILFGKAKINGVRDFTKVGLAKFVGDVATESVLQEGPQNYFTEKITHELTTDTPFQGKLLDFIDTRTVLDVAAGSGPVTFSYHTLDGLGALRAEKIKERTLEALNQKGLVPLVLDINKRLGQDAALALGYTMRLQGKFSKKEFENFATTIRRINELNEVVATKDLSDERKLATADKMFSRGELLAQQEAAQTQEKKDMIADEIKKIDQQINDLQDNTKEVKITTITDFKTGRVIYATDNETMAKELKTNGALSKNLFSGISEGVYVLNSEDEKLNKFVDKSIEFKKNFTGFMSKREELKNRYEKQRVQATKDRLSGKKNTPTDAQLENEYQAEIQNISASFGMGAEADANVSRAERLQNSQQTRTASDVVTGPQQFNIPESVANQSVFDGDESTTLDAFIEANKENAIASNVLNNIKTQVATFKQMFPEGKIFYHTTNQSFTSTYNKLTGSKELNVKDDGFFAETENGEIHINLSNPGNFNKMNQDVVSHEIVHGVLLKAFGKKVFDNNGMFLRWESDTQAISDMKTLLEGVVGRYGSSLNTFLGNRNYERAEEAEEFIAQLGAMLSRADENSPLEQGFVGRVLAAISQFVKDKTGMDVFAIYRKQSDAVQFLNYIGAQLKQGKELDEKKFVAVQGGFMIPRDLDPDGLSEGNLETGTVVAVHKSSENLNPILSQFTKRPGTSKLAYDLPVKTLEEAIKEHKGGVLLIMSDNTGFSVNPDTGEFVMGGYGYMAARRNIDAGIGFASVNMSTVGTTMTNAMAANDGNPVLALIVLSSPKAALGNYYALQYTFGSVANFLSTEKQSNEFKQSMIDVMRNKLALLDAFETNSKIVAERKAAKKLGDFSLVNELTEKSRTSFDKKFLPFFNSVNFNDPKSVQNFIKQFTQSKYSFPQRQELIDTILPSHEEIRQNKKTPIISKIFKDNGLNQIDFHNKYGEPYFVGDRLFIDDSSVNAPWGSVFGGFTIDPKADPLLIQNKGLTHPQFNAKVPGSNHFLLDGEYGVNQNFYDALQFGNPLKNPIDKMATQGIQPGTRLPASNKNPDALTSKERRDILLDRPMVKRSMEAYEEERGAVESLAEQFAKRLGVEYSFYFDENDSNLWSRNQTGAVQINTAKAGINTPIYGFSGIFLEMLMNENIVEYNKLVKSLLMDNSESSKAFRGNLEKALQNATIRSIEENNSMGLLTRDEYAQMRENVKEQVTLDAFRKIRMGEPNTPSIFQFDINSLQFLNVFQRVLNTEFAKLVAEEYEPNTGIYKALKQMWEGILEIIKNTLFPNKIKLKEASINSDVATPLGEWAKLLADPRNEFLRNTEEYQKMQMNTPTVFSDIANDLVNYEANTAEQNITLITNPNSAPFLTTVETLEDLTIAIGQKDDGTNFSKLNEKFSQEKEQAYTDILETFFDFLLGENNRSFSEFLSFGNFFRESSNNRFGTADHSEILDSLERYSAKLQTFIRAYDDVFRTELIEKRENYLQFRRILRHLYSMDLIKIDKVRSLYELSQQEVRDFDLSSPLSFRSSVTNFLNEGYLGFNGALDKRKSFVGFAKSEFLSDIGIAINQLGTAYEAFVDRVDVYASFEALGNVIKDDLNELSFENRRLIETYKNAAKAIDDILSKVPLDKTYLTREGSVGYLRNHFAMNLLTKVRSNGSMVAHLQNDKFKDFTATNSKQIGPNSSVFKILEFSAYLQNLNQSKIDFYATDFSNTSRNGEFDIVASSDKNVDDVGFSKQVIPKGTTIPMSFTTSLRQTGDTYGVDISFRPRNFSYGTFINWEGQIFEMFNKLINNIYALYQDIPIEFVTFSPVADSKVNKDGSAKNIRKNIYNLMAAKAFAPFYVTPMYGGTTIVLPLSKHFDSTANRIKPRVETLIAQEVDTINSTVKVKKSRAETLGKDSRQIENEYDRLTAEGKSREEIFGNLFGRYSYESMRASKYSADFQSVYDEFVSNKAKETWSTYSGTWNKRKQGVVDFVDKYIIENSLMDIVSALRKGVRFVEVNDQLLPEGENGTVVVEGMATPITQQGDVVNFSDLEIYSALFEYGIPQSNLDQIFGLNYRKTINNLLLDADFDTEIKQNLTEDARASKLTVSFSELNELSDQLGIMSSTAILNYILKHLSVEKGSPVIPAVKAIVDKINQARSMGEVLDEFGREVETIGPESVQALAEIGTAAGRILRILRELNKNKADVVIDTLKQSRIKVSPAFEQEIKNAFRNLDNARNAFENAKKKAIKDFTDSNIQELQRLEDSLLDAEYKIALIMSDPRLQFRFASEVLTNRAAMSLLSGQTAVLSAVSNVETLIAKYGVNQNIFKRLSESIINRIKPDVFSRSNARVYRLGKEEFRNRRLAFSLTHSRSVDQIKRAMLDGTVPNTAQAKFFENVAMVNSIRDAQNLVKLFGRFAKSFQEKNGLDDMDFADIMQVMLYEHKESGKIILADNKAYSVMGAMVRALMQPQEITSRLMALGMDKYAANVISKKALLDYVTMRTAMENSELPEGLIDELVKRGSMTNDAVNAPFVQKADKPVFFLPGGNPETELVNLNILMAAIFRDEQVNPFESEGLRATFYADNSFVKGLRRIRKGIRKGMVDTYLESLEAKAEGNRLKKYGYRAANAILQGANVAQWTIFPFPQIPSNILLQIVARSNPLGAALNSVYLGFLYYKNLNNFYKKYKIGKHAENVEETPQDVATAGMLPSQKALPSAGSQSLVTTTNGIDIFEAEDIDSPGTKDQMRSAKKKMNTQQKIEFEKEVGNLFSAKRRFVTAMADIGRSTEFLLVAGSIAASGAVLSSGDDDEKKRAMKKLGVNQNDLNVSYYLEYVKEKASNPKLTPEEFYRKRGGFKYNSSIPSKDLPEGFEIKDGVLYDNFGKKVSTDFYLNITNLGTFFGYGVGYMSSVYAKQRNLNSVENDKTEGFKEYFDMGSLLSSVTGSVFRQTPSIKLVQDALESLSEDSKKRGQGAQVASNMVASVMSVAAPSLLGKPRSQAEGETVQPSYEIEPSREEPNIGRLFLDAHMKLSRNGILGLGLGQSEFYQSEIGLFGEDMSMRKTVAGPQSFMSYLESAINFPGLRKGTEVNVNKTADEIMKYNDARNFLINSSYLATVYGNMGGDANRYWGILDRPRKNTFVITESETDPLTGVNPNKPFKLPNDIYRDELRILGDVMRNEAKNYISGYSLEKTKDLVRGAKNEEEAKLYIEQWFSELNETFSKAEAAYKENFLANRAPGIIRTMQDRGLLTEADITVLTKMAEDINIENVLTSEEQPRWKPVFDKNK
jgi:hypothetical protein